MGRVSSCFLTRSMKVLIIGAGRRGIRIGRHLAAEGSSITFLDRSESRCRAAQAKVDCLAVCGSGTDLAKLREAGAGNADTVIAVTDSDEVNIVSCGIIASEFPDVVNTIAAIRSAGYLGEEGLPPRILGITHIINPDQEGAQRLLDTIHYGLYRDTLIFPGTDFMIFTVQEGDTLRRGENIAGIRKRIPYNFVIAAIYRRGSVIIPSGDTDIRPGDIAVVITDSDKAYSALSGSEEQRAVYSEPDNIAILGATRITRFLLYGFSPKERKRVRLIEKDREAAEEFASIFPEITVLNASITDESIWEEEELGNVDLFISLTDNDELNIVTAGYARRIGARKAIAEIKSNTNYSQFALSFGVDVALSITDVTVDSLIRYLRGDGISAMHTLFEGELEVYEYVVQDTFPFLGKALKDIHFRSRIVIAGVRRTDGTSLVPDGEYVFNEGDSIIISIRHDESSYLKELFR